MRTVAVIPAYNERETVGSVIDGASQHVEEVVVVDDGSTDGTPDLAREAGATVIEHVFNTGVGGAVRTGYRYAIREDFDFVVQVDADGQHDPEEIPQLLGVAEDADMVIGSRYLNESFQEYSWLRDLGIRSFTAVVNLLGGVDVTDVTSGFRVYRVTALRRLLHRSDKHWAVEQTLEAARRDMDIREVSIAMPTRETGSSQFTVETFALYPLRMTDAILRVLLFRNP
ncbi:dolichol-phosphate mannosyltransferase protein [Halorhabdus tiamatea SARL4B]|uniref:Dolichol-phosphate mannosyltransferase protein n=1 Tax=Halorhabdus tiamatea SARL4B TaxID=1033806 RepID=F7PPZ9_9EURY|nr:glycosyltransferase family 2 protein [Halorhabdus tiamatea]ERJ07344.1 dolichol-phosphate mannosyltransferase protein [Halorhabdus tiamatea SARL4B]CCQ34121.1 glycosyltransferase [Halorhabdus tiamatea SARL4B]